MDRVVAVLISAGVEVFIANRLYVGLSKKQISVKAITIARDHSPISYWIVIVLEIIGLALGLVIVIANTGLLG